MKSTEFKRNTTKFEKSKNKLPISSSFDYQIRDKFSKSILINLLSKRSFTHIKLDTI